MTTGNSTSTRGLTERQYREVIDWLDQYRRTHPVRVGLVVPLLIRRMEPVPKDEDLSQPVRRSPVQTQTAVAEVKILRVRKWDYLIWEITLT